MLLGYTKALSVSNTQRQTFSQDKDCVLSLCTSLQPLIKIRLPQVRDQPQMLQGFIM